MTLSSLLQGVTVSKMFQTLYGQMVVTHDVEVRGIQYDSRRVVPGDLFVAIRGGAADGHKFLGDAIARGAKVAVLEDDASLPDSYFMHSGVVKVVVPDSRAALARISDRWYGHPSGRLTMVGVTGTNGKTTTTHLVRGVLEAAGVKSGLIGTIAYAIGGETIPATHTTPESLELNGLLARMAEAGCAAAVMEVSSHALHQRRVDGIDFQVGVFTNLTQDHLDYHRTMEEYFDAKKILFERLPAASWAVVNADDAWGGRMLAATGARKLAYGTAPPAELRAERVALRMDGMTFDAVHAGDATKIASALTGRFNVSNILAAFGVGIALGLSKSTIADAIRRAGPVKGRFEQVVAPAGWTAIIDYAHTPDALEKALGAVHDLMGERRGRIITVFGCGGDRDRTKRPRMGAIAARMSDEVVVTSDNPRSEEPGRIIDDIMAGIPAGTRVRREPDRAAAIRSALESARGGDVVLIAGKGHEEYQIVGSERRHFSDRETVEEHIAGR